MEIAIHKLKDEWVIFRYDKNETDRKRNKKSEYWTGTGWKSGLANAKRYRTENDAVQVLIKMRILSKVKVG